MIVSAHAMQKKRSATMRIASMSLDTRVKRANAASPRMSVVATNNKIGQNALIGAFCYNQTYVRSIVSKISPENI